MSCGPLPQKPPPGDNDIVHHVGGKFVVPQLPQRGIGLVRRASIGTGGFDVGPPDAAFISETQVRRIGPLSWIRCSSAPEASARKGQVQPPGPIERPPFGPNAYDDACNSPDPADNGGVGRRHNGAVTMGFSGHVDVINFRKWEAEQLRKPGLLFCNPFTKDGL